MPFLARAEAVTNSAHACAAVREQKPGTPERPPHEGDDRSGQVGVCSDPGRGRPAQTAAGVATSSGSSATSAGTSVSVIAHASSATERGRSAATTR